MTECSENGKVSMDDWMKLVSGRIAAGQKLQISPRGSSMYPLLVGKRDEVILTRLDRPLKRGDICMFRRYDGTYVIHSIHHIDHGNLYFLGESQIYIEGPIAAEQVVARAESFVRKGREYSCSSLWYRMMHEIWIFLRPLRPILIETYRSVMKRH